MIVLGLAMVKVAGIAALGIDVCRVYWNKHRLQSGTYAVALAGTIHLNEVTFAGRNVSCIYLAEARGAARSDGFDNGVSPRESAGLVGNSNSQSTAVSASCATSAPFARLVGIQNFTVSATFVALLAAVCFRQQRALSR